jgi:hypothetical protein
MTVRVQIGGPEESEEKPKRFVASSKRKKITEDLDPV